MTENKRKLISGPFIWVELTPEMHVYRQESGKEIVVGQVLKTAKGYWAYHFPKPTIPKGLPMPYNLRVAEKFDAAQRWVESQCTSDSAKP